MTPKHNETVRTTKRDIGAEIIDGLRGFRDRPEALNRTKFGPLDVKATRAGFGMSQSQFAAFLFISVRTLQKWEQGQRSPDGAAKTLKDLHQTEQLFSVLLELRPTDISLAFDAAQSQGDSFVGRFMSGLELIDDDVSAAVRDQLGIQGT